MDKIIGIIAACIVIILLAWTLKKSDDGEK